MTAVPGYCKITTCYFQDSRKVLQKLSITIDIVSDPGVPVERIWSAICRAFRLETELGGLVKSSDGRSLIERSEPFSQISQNPIVMCVFSAPTDIERLERVRAAFQKICPKMNDMKVFRFIADYSIQWKRPLTLTFVD
jgi:hypothetical protein